MESPPRTGQGGWQGRTLLHDSIVLPDPVPMLDLLARAGASLQARIDGRSLLRLGPSFCPLTLAN